MGDSDDVVTLLGVGGPAETGGLSQFERQLGQMHLRAVLDYVEHAETEPLRHVRTLVEAWTGGHSLGDVVLVFDLYAIQRMAAKGAIDFESIYES